MRPLAHRTRPRARRLSVTRYEQGSLEEGDVFTTLRELHSTSQLRHSCFSHTKSIPFAVNVSVCPTREKQKERTISVPIKNGNVQNWTWWVIVDILRWTEYGPEYAMLSANPTLHTSGSSGHASTLKPILPMHCCCSDTDNLCTPTLCNNTGSAGMLVRSLGPSSAAMCPPGVYRIQPTGSAPNGWCEPNVTLRSFHKPTKGI